MLPWNRIKTVLLDLDGTLLDLNYDNTFWNHTLPASYAKKHRVSLEKATDTVNQFAESVKGSLPWYCVDIWSKELDIDILALKKELKHLIAPRPHVYELLTWLHQNLFEVILVTNAHPKSLDIKLECAPLRQYFHALYTSHEFGTPKENNQFWIELNKAQPFDPEHTVLIDDNLEVLRAAQSHGVAYLCVVLQPDLQRPPRNINEFPGISHFSQLIPVL